MHSSSNPTEKHDDMVLDASLRNMAGVLDKESISMNVSGDPVINAGVILSSSMKFQIKTVNCVLEGSSREKFRRFADINGFRVRDVMLEDGWWKHDCGALLAFAEEGDVPVCLIRESSSYYMINAETGEKRKVTEKTALQLHPVSMMIYKPFPNRKLKFSDLYKMSAADNKRDLIIVFLIGSLGGILGTVTPAVTGIIFDTSIPEADSSGLFGFIIILACLGFARGMFDITKGLCGVKMRGRFSNTLQSALWDRLLGLSVPFFSNFTAGELATKSLSINSIVQTFSGATMGAVLAAVFSVYNLFLLFYYSMSMALIAILLTGVIISYTFAINYFRISKQAKSVEINNRSMGFLYQIISGIVKIRMTGSYKRAFAKYSEIFVEKKETDYSIGKAENLLLAFNSMFSLISGMVIFSWVLYKVNADITTGQFIAFNAAYGAFQGALLNMAGVVTESLNVIPLYKGLQPIFNELPESSEEKLIPDRLKSNLSVDQVCYRYEEDGPLILDNVSISAEEGQFIAIVGGSGAGKSTVLRLLLGFDKPCSGTVFYDNHDLDSLDALEVRKQLGVVLQNDTLVQGSLMENIIGQSGTLTLDDAWFAAEKAGLAEEIKQMPMGMSTVIPAGGDVLSGGQKQRVIIARALAKKPDILLFDEATSALDNVVQAEISRNLEQLDVTRIVIAHRLSTIKDADCIYVLDKGKVVQKGRYDNLISAEGLFKELAKRQTA